MKNIFIPDDYRKIDESPNMVVYEVKTDDRFMGFICRRYDVKLCLCINKNHIKGYMCMCRIYNHHSTFNRRVVTFRNKKFQFFTPYVEFLKNCDSFQSNIAECIKSFKLKIVDLIIRDFNILTEYGEDGDLGILPYGSSENEIIMKMKLMGLI